MPEPPTAGEIRLPTPVTDSLPLPPEGRVRLWVVPDDAGVPLPEEIGRVGGVHWWDPDRRRHLADMPRHCPGCGSFLGLEGGMAVEYWEADRRVYHTWCRACSWTGDIVRIRRMVGHEPVD